MLLALIICHLSVFATANPFHKYPFVFLLDVGNEELEKTNSEQIRVSVPGGSVALRYPAIGDGSMISHVRVSGIDFGTDLKANIVDGGPGYKYVVLVFIGNPGIPYDAVVTVQTITDSILSNTPSLGPAESDEEDENNSAEDLSDTNDSNIQNEVSIQNSNAELMQSSANIYSYVEKESIEESDYVNDDVNEKSVNSHNDDTADSEQNSNELINDSDDNDEYNDDNNERDVQNPYSDYQQNSKGYIKVKAVETDENAADNDDDEEQINSSVDKSYVDSEPIIVDSNLYSKYKALQDHLNFARQVYSQEDLQKSNIPVYQEDPLDYEEIDLTGPVYDDEELNNRAEKFRDYNNNNYIDSDDSYAIAY